MDQKHIPKMGDNKGTTQQIKQHIEQEPFMEPIFRLGPQP